MAEEPSLVSLPVEVLLMIGDYLRPRDLAAVSGVCRYLRSAFNVNSIWRKYTDDGCTSQGLNNTQSLVEPKFLLPRIKFGATLEPICEHRYHFLKQSRLISNLQSGKFVKDSSIVEDHLPLYGYLVKVSSPAITYRNRFLFTIGHVDDSEVIKIYDIGGIRPEPIKSLKPENHSDNKNVVLWCNVVGDKLIVQNGLWYDIYVIRLPQSLDILKSINVGTSTTQRILIWIMGNFMFKDNLNGNVVHVWNLSSGNQLNDIHPKIDGPNFNTIGFSQNEQFVIFSIGMYVGEPSNPHVFVYDVELQDFSSFNPLMNQSALKCHVCIGLMDSDYVVLLNDKYTLMLSIFVYDYRESTLVVENSRPYTGRIQDAKIVDGCLVLPLETNVLVMDLKSLETLWELNSTTALIYGFATRHIQEMHVLHVSSLRSIIVIHKESGAEVWDFHKRRRILEIEDKIVFTNDTCSKLICNDFGKIVILSFW